MARTDTLTNFLTDVADAIRDKTGNDYPIYCEDFDTEIESISGDSNLQAKNITITTNTTTNITPDTGYDGLSSVAVTTNVSGGGSSFGENIITLYSDVPFSTNGGIVAKGTDLYIFGGTDNKTLAYKYNCVNEVYTKLTNIPYSYYDSRAISIIGDDIYLFGGSGGNTTAYKYNITNNSYTRLTNIPYQCTYGSAVPYGTDIYIFGSNVTNNNNKAYKYNTITDTYTQLTNIPFYYHNTQCTISGDMIYLMGSSYTGYRNYAYKYDINNDSYTRLTDIPYEVNAARMAIYDNYLYIFGGNTQPKYVYKYDITNDTYTQLRNLLLDFANASSAVTVTSLNRIYLINAKTKQMMF